MENIMKYLIGRIIRLVLFAPYTPRFQPSDLRAPLRAMSIVFLVLGSLRPRKGGTHREKRNRLSSNRTENPSNWATEKENIDGWEWRMKPSRVNSRLPKGTRF